MCIRDRFYTEEEILDKHIGKKGTPKRDQFEADLNSFLIGEAIKQAQISPLYILKEDIIQAGINPESICSDDF